MLSEKEVIRGKSHSVCDWDRMANAPETPQEDKAFLNRVKKINPRDMQVSEIQRLFRIAERGMEK